MRWLNSDEQLAKCKCPYFSESAIALYLQDAIALLIFDRAIIFRTSKIFCYNQFNFDKTTKY
ncbi:hypothetical protein [Planktothrix mougeotii]|uniref:Uncharacterized protein n=1 Tax=Planktothrix mougeotii LEGE 06226 TaxID=1828728 RepID=A0ABR9U5Z4_9CYAN|nr:hypothetical protein [Planktothrix mougeotii]MBE9141880.1 hypothetical protein [Planktothrix mougeotii LEGE 06226]